MLGLIKYALYSIKTLLKWLIEHGVLLIFYLHSIWYYWKQRKRKHGLDYDYLNFIPGYTLHSFQCASYIYLCEIM